MKVWAGMGVMLLAAAAVWLWQDITQEAPALSDASEREQAAAAGETVHVALMDSGGRQVGNVHLTETEEGLRIHLKANQLPAGTHAFHVHEKGVCEAPDFESAGSHYNPTGRQHGFLDRRGPHAGDLPNITVDASGQAEPAFVTNRLTLKPGKKTTLFSKSGTAFVVHEGADDYFTDPAGDAGSRIACGVIAPPK